MTDRLAAPQEGRIDLLTTDCALTSRAYPRGVVLLLIGKRKCCRLLLLLLSLLLSVRFGDIVTCSAWISAILAGVWLPLRIDPNPTACGVHVYRMCRALLNTPARVYVCVRTHACLHTLRTCVTVRVRSVCVHSKQHPRTRTPLLKACTHMYALTAFHRVLLTTIHVDNSTTNARIGGLSATWRLPWNSGRTRALEHAQRVSAHNKCICQRTIVLNIMAHWRAISGQLQSSQLCSAGMAELIGVDAWRLVASTQTVSKSSHLSRH